MITAPVVYQQAIKIKLPQAQSGVAEKLNNEIAIVMNAKGSITINQKPYSFDELKNFLNQNMAKLKSAPISISADESSQHGDVVKLMDALRKHGVTHFAIKVARGT